MKAAHTAYWIPAAAILLVGAALRLVNLDRGLWLDEFYALDIARSEAFVASLQLHNYPPAYFMLLRLWSSLSQGESFLRLLSVVMGAASILVMMAWLRQLSAPASLLGGALLASAPIFLRYSQEIQVYPLLVLCFITAFYAARRIAASGDLSDRTGLILLCAALAAAGLTHMIGAFMIPSLGLYLLPTLWRSKDKRAWLRLTMVLGIPAAVSLLSFLFFAGGEKPVGWWMPPLSWELVSSQFKYVLGYQALFAPAQLLAGIHPAFYFAYDWGIKILLIVSLGLTLLLGDWRRGGMLLAAALVFWLQIVLVSAAYVPIFWYRTLLPGAVPLLAFIALQAVTIKKPTLRLLAASGLVIIGLASAAGWALSEARAPKEDWKAAGQHLQGVYTPGDLVLFYPSYAEGPARYYFPDLRDQDALSIPLGANQDTIEQALRARLSPAQNQTSPPAVFLVVRPDGSVANDAATYSAILAALEALPASAAPPAEFTGVTIHRFSLVR